MSITRSLAETVLRGYSFIPRLLGRAVQSLAAERLSQEVVWDFFTPHGPIKLWCPTYTAYWRAKTLTEKEPETLAWIDGFAAGDVLWDIGANVGLYSLYAAQRGVTVLAFEPLPANLHALTTNIELNGFDRRIAAYGLAFSDTTRLDYLNVSSPLVGAALSSFGSTLDVHGHSCTPQVRLATIGYGIDRFMGDFSPPFPNHIKLDVDSIEVEILHGAATVLADPRLQSVSVEINEAVTLKAQAITDALQQAGLTFLHRRHSPMFDHGAHKDSYNYVFIRPI